MKSEEYQVGEAVARIAFVAFVLWMFAHSFDYTEGLVIGLYAVMEGIQFHWRNR